jgi:hypothetical protein
MNKNNKNQTYWAELQIAPNNKIKIKKANILVPVNQFKNKWYPTDARNLARAINNGDMVIK